MKGRPKRSWEDNIRMNLREAGWEGVDWMHLVENQDQCRAFVNTVMNSQVPWKEGNFLTTLVTLTCWRTALLHGI